MSATFKAGLVVMAVVAATPDARDAAAAESDAVEALSPPPRRPMRWYGWQILLADGAAAGVIALGTQLPSPSSGVLAGAGLLGYIGDGPLIHSLHGQSAKGGVSVLLRLVLPLVGGTIGYLAGLSNANAHASGGVAESLGNGFVPLADGVIGFGVGMTIAAVADATALAWAPGHVTSSASAPRGAFALAPAISLTTGERREGIPIFGVRGSL